MNRNYKVLDIDYIWGDAWENAKKHFLSIFAMNVIIYICTNVIGGMFYNTTELMSFLQNATAYSDSPEVLINELSPVILNIFPSIMFGSLIGWLLAAYFNVALYRLLMDGVKGLRVDLGERIKGAWTGCLNYILCVLVLSIILSLATLFFILPGIFLAVRLVFVPIIAANKPEKSLGEVFSESWHLSEGHFWTLLGYGIVAILANIVGYICCCVGILFSRVVTQFLLANTYYALTGEEEKKELE